MTKQTSSAKALAIQIKDTLGWIELYFPAVATEMERVLNLGIPLSDALNRGLVHSVTDAGRDALWSTDQDLIIVRAILEDYPEVAQVSFPNALWDKVQERKEIHAAGGTVYSGSGYGGREIIAYRS